MTAMMCRVCETWKDTTRKNAKPDEFTCGRFCTDYYYNYHSHKTDEEIRILYREYIRRHKYWSKFVFNRRSA